MGKELSPVTVVKDLGVTFDMNLTFYDDILKTVSSCMFSLAQISRVKHMLISIGNHTVSSSIWN